MKLVDLEQIYCSDCEYRGNCQNVFCDVKEMPSVDAVPVVRCQECLYAQERYGHIECLHGISYRNTYNDPDMFCSYGQRKDSDHEA